MSEITQPLATTRLTTDDLAHAFLEFLDESPRSSSVREWAAAYGVPSAMLRGWQKDRFVAWLRVPKDNRQPKTQGLLAEWLGVSDATLSAWGQLPEIIASVGRGAIAQVQELVPAAVKRLEEDLSSFDGLEVAKFIVNTSTKGAMPTAVPSTNVAVQLNLSKADQAIAASVMPCGHTQADHGVYFECPDTPQAVLDAIPACTNEQFFPNDPDE